MNIAEHLKRSAQLHPDLPAVAVGETVTLNYGGLAERSARLAGGLLDTLGLQPGDTVALIQKE